MFKYLLLLAVGVAIGYGYGWKDAQQNQKNVFERTVERIGGETRDRLDNDMDTRYSKSESR